MDAEGMYPRQWLARLVVEASQTDGIEGVGVGGSHGAGEADIFSDWDIFVLVTSEKLCEAFVQVPDFVLTLIPDCAGLTYPTLATEFGLKYCVFSSSVGLCDIFLLDKNAETSPLRERTEILWERDSKFSELIDRAVIAFRDPEVQIAHNGRLSVQLVSEYIGAVRSAVRGRPLQARYRAYKVLNLLLGAAKGLGEVSGWWYSHCIGDNVVAELGEGGMVEASDLAALNVWIERLGISIRHMLVRLPAIDRNLADNLVDYLTLSLSRLREE